MASYRLYSAIFASFALVACSSAGGSSQSSDGTNGGSATGVSPEAFCDSQCIDADHDACMTFATRFSDAFLAAFEACGDDPGCIQPRLDAAKRTPSQDRFASAYCKACDDADACLQTFWQHDQAGGPLAQLSDARLGVVSDTCLSKLDASGGAGMGKLTCELSLTQCELPILQEDLKNTAVCRKR
jgi:hypothetical protein